MSFRAFRARTFDNPAGGLGCQTSALLGERIDALVLRDGAGLLMTTIFIRPGTANTPGPFLPTAFLMDASKGIKHRCDLLRESSVVSAMQARIFSKH